MLKSLHVHNFALLEDAEVEFAPGFNIFTGETGAGKSILIDAFGIVLGSRASTEYIRSGTDAFWVQAVFDVSGNKQVQAALAAQDVELADENLFLKRKLNTSGKGQCSVNGVPVPLAVLRSLSRMLVDIHGQHENQDLLEAKTPLKVLAAAGGAKLAAALSAYQESYAAYQAAAGRVQELEHSSADRELLLDRYGWEIKEITEAKLRSGEQEELQAENRKLQNGARILDDVTEAHGALDDESGALNALAGAKESLRDALRYDGNLNPLVEALDSAWITADDARQQLAAYRDNADGGDAQRDNGQHRRHQPGDRDANGRRQQGECRNITPLAGAIGVPWNQPGPEQRRHPRDGGHHRGHEPDFGAQQRGNLGRQKENQTVNRHLNSQVDNGQLPDATVAQRIGQPRGDLFLLFSGQLAN